MGKQHLKSPALKVIEAFGGVRPCARLLELSPSSICRWAKPKAERGSGGLIPSEHHRLILDTAKQHGKPITAEDLIAAA